MINLPGIIIGFAFWFIIWVLRFLVMIIEATLAFIIKWVKKPLDFLLTRTMPKAIKNHNQFIK